MHINLKKSFRSAGHAIDRWHRGLFKTMKFWDPHSVRKGVSQQWRSHKADILGRSLDSLVFPASNASSFGSYSSGSLYGSSGSIVGKY